MMLTDQLKNIKYRYDVNAGGKHMETIRVAIADDNVQLREMVICITRKREPLIFKGSRFFLLLT